MDIIPQWNGTEREEGGPVAGLETPTSRGQGEEEESTKSKKRSNQREGNQGRMYSQIQKSGVL